MSVLKKLWNWIKSVETPSNPPQKPPLDPRPSLNQLLLEYIAREDGVRYGDFYSSFEDFSRSEIDQQIDNLTEFGKITRVGLDFYLYEKVPAQKIVFKKTGKQHVTSYKTPGGKVLIASTIGGGGVAQPEKSSHPTSKVSVNSYSVEGGSVNIAKTNNESN